MLLKSKSLQIRKGVLSIFHAVLFDKSLVLLTGVFCKQDV